MYLGARKPKGINIKPKSAMIDKH